MGRSIGPRQAAIDVVQLVREIKSRPPLNLVGDVAALEIEVAAAGDIIDELKVEIEALETETSHQAETIRLQDARWDKTKACPCTVHGRSTMGDHSKGPDDGS